MLLQSGRTMLGLNAATRAAAGGFIALNVAGKALMGPAGWLISFITLIPSLFGLFNKTGNKAEELSKSLTFETAEAGTRVLNNFNAVVTAAAGDQQKLENALNALVPGWTQNSRNVEAYNKQLDAHRVKIEAAIKVAKDLADGQEEDGKPKGKTDEEKAKEQAAAVKAMTKKYTDQSDALDENNLVKKELAKVSEELFEGTIDLNEHLDDSTKQFYKLADSVSTAIKQKQAMAQEIQVINDRYATMGGFIQLGGDLFQDQMNADVEKARKTGAFLLAQKRDDTDEMERIEKAAMKKSLAGRQAMFLAEKALAISNIIVQYQIAEAKGWGSAGPIFGIPLATAMKLNMVAAIALIASQAITGMPKFAQGGDFVTQGPQMIMVGDNPGGRERVSVTPLSSPNNAGPEGGASVTVNVSGNVMSSDYVEGELAEQIKEAIRRGTDFGIS